MAFLGIRIPHETGRLLTSIEVPGENTAASDMHITILHFEEHWPITEISKAMETTYDIVSKIKPFIAMTDEVTCFPKRDGKSAIITPIRAAELHELREKLAEEFEKSDIDFSKTFKDYKPHITLSYADDEIEDFSIDPVEFSVQELVLWGGDHGEEIMVMTVSSLLSHLKGPRNKNIPCYCKKLICFSS